MLTWLKSSISKKLATVALTFALAALNRKMNLGLSEAEVTQLVTAVIAYLLAQGAVDVAKVIKDK
jgi:hypothetical protein